jgi:agmatine deiminase
VPNIAPKPTQPVTIGLIQTTVSPDAQLNLAKTAEKIKQAAKAGAQIICLQELYRARYFPQQEQQDATRWAETVPGESTQTFAALAKKYQIVLVVPLFEKAESGKYYNTAVTIDADGKILGAYRKIHIPQDPLFYEKSYFEAGNTGYAIYKTRYGCIGVLICYDQWFPEAARIETLKGADMLFYPTAIGYIKDHTSSDGDWHEAWKTVQRGHAIANGVHVAAVNRVGEEDELEFWGGSFVCDAFGKVLKEASTTQEENLIVQIDLADNKKIRDGWGFLRNRRPDTYAPLLEHGMACCTPNELGYRMPAEWEKHDAIWLSWPHDPNTFTSGVEKVEKTYLQIIKAIHQSEDVNLFVKNNTMKQKVAALLQQEKIDPGRVHFFEFDYADVWFRDYGPIFVKTPQGQLARVRWIFNSWGEKYVELLKDSQIPGVINGYMGSGCFEPGIVLEGGSIDVNGKGTLLTTEQCLLNPNRNPHLTKPKIEQYLTEYLGVTHFIWLKNGICGDDTDGHIDDLARFVNPTTIVCAFEEDPNDENYPILKENYDSLLNSTDQDGNPLTVVKLPMPRVVDDHNQRLPASYTNFYIGNTVVLVPTFGKPTDKPALDILQKLFPERRVVGINCFDLVHGLGTIHCISQQQPTANTNNSPK